MTISIDPIQLMIFLIVFSFTFPAFMSLIYYFGMLRERKDWNKLIDEGKIPNPKGK